MAGAFGPGRSRRLGRRTSGQTTRPVEIRWLASIDRILGPTRQKKPCNAASAASSSGQTRTWPQFTVVHREGAWASG